MVRLMISRIIQIIGVIILLPFAIIKGIFSGLSRARSKDINQQNGADIRALCSELGVPSNSYNRIVVNQMERAKDLALRIGRPGAPHHASPWNTRLAIAIATIHREQSEAAGVNADDVFQALLADIDKYLKTHGKLPKCIVLDDSVHAILMNSSINEIVKDILENIEVSHETIAEHGVLWKIPSPSLKDQSFNDFDDDIPF